MSNEHTKHAGKDSLEAMHENDAHTVGQDEGIQGGEHAHSHATHEAGGKASTHTAENQRTHITELEERSHRLNRGTGNNRGVGAGLRGDSGTRGQ